MQSALESNLENLPVGDLGIVATESCQSISEKIDRHIVEWRRGRDHVHSSSPDMDDYSRDSYLIESACPRFGTGEGKGQIFSSVRGDDLYILVDVCNHSITYKLRGLINHMSPDDHYQDLKRLIAAIGGKARRITVIMPYLYESRQDKRNGRESLDCAIALQELISMGVDSIITFDAHDPRVQNAIPLHGFETFQTAYQFIKGLCRTAPDIRFTPDEMMVITPDEAGMKRAIYMTNVLGVDMGMFYKRRDYTRLVGGRNPIVAHEFLGRDLSGKDCIVVDDMISSGESMLDVCRELKARNARRIFICATFGLFTNGLERFDKAYEEGMFDALLTTNLVYQTPELLARPYYTSCDMSKYLALIIDTMNHDGSLSQLLNPVDRINRFFEKHPEFVSHEADKKTE
ncbi:MAG: ribose-phosphate pyrophosphokinase [Lachnospiraceae bacterium]|nr:ribose-phosphate pyrophosphokinase [Lachnospiraceae bacterium]